MDSPLPPLPPGSNHAPAPPPIASPRRRAQNPGGWRTAAIILLVLLGLSFMLHLMQLAGFLGLASSMGTRGSEFQEVVLEENSTPNKIVVVQLTGTIEGGMVPGPDLPGVIQHQLRRAEEDSDVKGVVLHIDSPGGEVLASDEIANRIRDFQKKTGKPVVAAMGSMAASGGYYVAAACEWIVANELTMTGSIGVLMYGYNYRGLMDKVGIVPQVYTSGPLKTMMSGTKRPSEISDQEQRIVQGLVNETFEKFKSVVREGRAASYKLNKSKGRALRSNWSEITDGRVLSGRQAFDYGLVDEMGDFKVAVKRAQTLAGISSANVVQYATPFRVSDLLHLFGKSESSVVKVDLGLDKLRLQAGRMYFLPSHLFF